MTEARRLATIMALDVGVMAMSRKIFIRVHVRDALAPVIHQS